MLISEILWGLTIALVILLVVAIGISIYFSTYKRPPGPRTVPKCSTQTQKLPDITNQQCCVGQSGVKYLSSLLVEVGPDAIPYQNICKQFCPAGQYNLSTDTCNTGDGTVINNVKNCVNATKPNGCTGAAQPVATSNHIPYFAVGVSLTPCIQGAC